MGNGRTFVLLLACCMADGERWDHKHNSAVRQPLSRRAPTSLWGPTPIAAAQEEDILIESHSQDGIEGGRGGTGQQPAENQWRLKRGAGGDMADMALCTPAPKAPPSSSKTPHAGGGYLHAAV
jgi:hypothetical protein